MHPGASATRRIGENDDDDEDDEDCEAKLSFAPPRQRSGKRTITSLQQPVGAWGTSAIRCTGQDVRKPKQCNLEAHAFLPFALPRLWQRHVVLRPTRFART